MWQDLQLQNDSSFQYNLKLLKPSTFPSHLYFLTKKKKNPSSKHINVTVRWWLINVVRAGKWNRWLFNVFLNSSACLLSIDQQDLYGLMMEKLILTKIPISNSHRFYSNFSVMIWEILLPLHLLNYPTLQTTGFKLSTEMWGYSKLLTGKFFNILCIWSKLCFHY